MPVPSSPPALRLAEHVRACRVGDQMIFLDLLRSQYIGVGGPQAAALSATLLGEAGGQSSTLAADPTHFAQWTQQLRQRHLLCEGPAAGAMPTQPALPMPNASLGTDEEGGAVASDWRHLARLWRSTLVTATWLRRRSLADIASRVTALRARHTHTNDDLSAASVDAVAASYLRLRPFALTTHDRCLHDSLALIHFLTTRGLIAQWVIGVRLRPFGAHSWVQRGSVVLNDQPDHVRAYQPILVV